MTRLTDALGFLLILLATISVANGQNSFKLAQLQYGGGGDWYGDQTALTNLIGFCNNELKANINPEKDYVEVGSADLFLYPYVFMTGHGNVVFTETEARNLRNYLVGGGFLHIDDNYGLNEFARREMKKVFPELSFVELPFAHPVYHQKFNFDNGLPKIHKHDDKAPQGFGLVWQGRLVCFFSFESDLGNGWEDQSMYNDPEELRLAALRMGANLISYATTVY